jgi:hypothetical protein
MCLISIFDLTIYKNPKQLPFSPSSSIYSLSRIPRIVVKNIIILLVSVNLCLDKQCQYK